MTALTQYWQQLAPRARWGLVGGLGLIIVLTVILGLWALRPEYKVLFANLATQDAAAMVEELDRMKVPYSLAEEGSTIQVAAEDVYKTRLHLAGKLPMQGTVGLELFSESDFGMTEFAQKVNYQRGQQGELTRTIMAIDGVQSARVHLALPDQGLFKKAAQQSKASVTLVLKPDAVLKREQVSGIQQLVSASIPNIQPADVTVLDQRGVALTSGSDGEDGAAGSAEALDAKRSVEKYLGNKVADVLDKTFGAGHSVASIDVVLSHDRAKTTTESVLPAVGGDPATAPAGVVVRERQSSRPGTASASAGGKEGEGDLIESELDYQVGRRVEQVVAARGAIRRINVAVVVKKSLDAVQADKVKDVVALAVGLDRTRGDAISVYSLDQLAISSEEASLKPLMDPATPASATAAASSAGVLPARATRSGPGLDTATVPAVLLLLVVLVLAVWYGRRKSGERSVPTRQLADSDRHALLAQVQHWIDVKPSSSVEQRR
jgi:flagellar M-ring protein FliF